MKKVIIDGKCMKSEITFHRTVKRLFDLDDHYGENLDALWDILTERRELNIKIINRKKLLEYLGDYGQQILNLFEDLKKERDSYKIGIY